MNDAEVNAMAQGMMLYLMQECKETTDALGVILCLVLLFYEKANISEANFSIEEFSAGFARDMIHHWKSRIVRSKGTETVQ